MIVAAGGGAGIAAVFNAPMGGFFYAIEELLRQAGPLLVCCVASYAVARLSHEHSIYQRQLTLLPAPGGHPDGLKMHSTPLKPRDL